MFSFSHQI